MNGFVAVAHYNKLHYFVVFYIVTSLTDPTITMGGQLPTMGNNSTMANNWLLMGPGGIIGGLVAAIVILLLLLLIGGVVIFLCYTHTKQ